MTPDRSRLTLLATFGLLAGPLVSMLDTSVVNVAVPVLARDLHAELAVVQWAVSAYLLALGAALSVSAYMAKRLGTKSAYVASLSAFTAASVLCSMAPTIEFLIVARLVQGAAGAALLPISMSMLMGSQSEETRGQIPPVAGVVLLAAPALGPTVGGALIGAFGWQSIFLVNVPFGILGIVGVLQISPQIAAPADRNARFDPLGMLMLGAGLGLGVYGLATVQEHGWFAVSAWPFWTAGLALLAAYVVWATRIKHPAVDLGLVRSLRSAVGLSVIILATVVLGAVLFLIPIYVQSIQGYGALHAGLVLLPQDLVMAIGLVLSNRLSQRGLARPSAVAGAVLLTGTTALLLTTSLTSPAWVVALFLGGRGLALALIVQPVLDALMVGIPSSKLADANTLFNVVQRVAGSFAIALLATLLEQRERFHLTHALQGQQAAMMAGWLDVILALVGLSLAALVLALLFRPARVAVSSASVAATNDQPRIAEGRELQELVA